MRDCKLPNTVGRIDAIVEAIEQGDRTLAMNLLRDENDRLNEKKNDLAKQLNTVFNSMGEVQKTIKLFNNDPGYFESVSSDLQRAKS